MQIEFSPNILEVLSRSRIDRIQERLAAIRECVASAPDRTSWVRHIPIPLASSDSSAAQDELFARLSKSGQDWVTVTLARANGGHIGFASDLFRPSQTHHLDAKIPQFLLFDLHSGLVAWWLSHLWRAADFAEATCVSLAEWLVLPASACARALLEGVAAFMIEGEQLLTEWSEFKQRGVPEIKAVMEFRDQFKLKLTQAQLGTRISYIGNTSPLLKRTNIMTLLEKFAKRVGGDVMTNYEWLCDAVHPSFGFQTVYTATHGLHKAGSTIAVDLARRTDTALTHSPKIDPTVAWACADVFIASLDVMLAEALRIRWLIDDFGLTTGIAFTGLELSLGSSNETSKTDNCLCGSGLSFEACTHKWGVPSIPPEILIK